MSEFWRQVAASPSILKWCAARRRSSNSQIFYSETENDATFLANFWNWEIRKIIKHMLTYTELVCPRLTVNNANKNKSLLNDSFKFHTIEWCKFFMFVVNWRFIDWLELICNHSRSSQSLFACTCCFRQYWLLSINC